MFTQTDPLTSCPGDIQILEGNGVSLGGGRLFYATFLTGQGFDRVKYEAKA